MTKSLLSVSDLSRKEIEKIFKKMNNFKTKSFMRYKGKSVGLLFEKHSTRTRLSFEVAISRLGAYPIYINKSDTQISRGESIAETAKIFSLYLDALIYRTSDQENMKKFHESSSIPIVNALSDDEHPTQIISDVYTINELLKKKNLQKMKIVYFGDGNNIANSLCIIADILNLNLVICCPKSYEPDLKKLNLVNSNIIMENNPKKAVHKADVIYTDVWTSMGMEKQEKQRLKDFKDYQVNQDLTSLANKSHIFMHCLPAHIDEEVTLEVLHSKNSVIYKQAENKVYAAMAILDFLLS
ncbi:ornithine carbamoyltransferase [bacterium]|mgnify:FL=1|jgi:ornithine carbamoyltransferase|nr:ornithine carbamoyltransferase [bacterium]MBT3795436.1 ornithine carbamoyltransferase [bacterium]MBT4633997.1 ornithine carbamoyltransferase [bacterium]